MTKSLSEDKQKLGKIKEYEAHMKESINQDLFFNEIFSFSREQLQNKLPVKIDHSAIMASQQAIELHVILEEFEKLKVNFIESIHNIYHLINDENMVAQMSYVTQNKLLEEKVI